MSEAYHAHGRVTNTLEHVQSSTGCLFVRDHEQENVGRNERAWKTSWNKASPCAERLNHIQDEPLV